MMMAPQKKKEKRGKEDQFTSGYGFSFGCCSEERSLYTQEENFPNSVLAFGWACLVVDDIRVLYEP